MRVISILMAWWMLAPVLFAQSSNKPVSLALVIENSAASLAGDLLTIELSGQETFQLLERTEIDKIYREQAVAVGNQNYLRLGQLLGADGLLLLKGVKEGDTEFLAVRLVAIKPGVVIRETRLPWHQAEALAEAKWIATYFRPFFTKLAVSPRDAIPLSIVNLRSAMKSSESETLERQLSLLLTRRLSQQRELFVLERRRMDLVTAETELQGIDETPFWNGSYLLDGVIDRDGYSKEILTIHARLAPPRGGVSLSVEISGARTNLPQIITELTAKVLEGLKLAPHIGAWNAFDEAAQYFEEANWAFKWRMYPEAQAAAESAWALGMRNVDSAILRVKSYLPQVYPDTGGYHRGAIGTQVGLEKMLEAQIQKLRAAHPVGMVIESSSNSCRYTFVIKLPDRQNLARAAHALRLFMEFSSSMAADEPKVGSPWYKLGVETLEAASLVLQHFHFVPEVQSMARDELPEVRVLARSLASWLTRSPSVRDAYWVRDRVANGADLFPVTIELPNIFRCKLNWGAFWQEKPEECLGVYRELMSSPAFSSIHGELWGNRDLEKPRLTAWNAEDRKRVPSLWKNFTEELSNSPNVFFRMEANARAIAEAQTDEAKESALTSLQKTILENRDWIRTNTIDLLSIDWGGGFFRNPNGVNHASRGYAVQIEALAQEVKNRARALLEEKATLAAFEQQKQYLTNNTVSDFRDWTHIFRPLPYTALQLNELQPLVASYKSNLVSQVKRKTGQDKAQLQAVLNLVGILERRLQPSVAPVSKATGTNSQTRKETNIRSLLSRPAAPPATVEAVLSPITPAIKVNRFCALPKERLRASVARSLRIFAHRWREEKMWLDLRYDDFVRGGGLIAYRSAAAAWSPEDDRWEIIQFPEYVQPAPTDHFKSGPAAVPFTKASHIAPVGYMGDVETGLHFEVFDGALYLFDWETLRKYDLKASRWETLQVPGNSLAQLFAFDGHLFAANAQSIYEIAEGGQGIRVLASCRRRPAASALDTLEHFGRVTLFPGPDHSLGATIQNAIYFWDGRDWKLEMPAFSDLKLSESEGGTLLKSAPYGEPATIWLIRHDQRTPELCWKEPSPDGNSRSAGPNAKPTWNYSKEYSFARALPASAESNLYFFFEHCSLTNVAGRMTVTDRDGRHANLICLVRNHPIPLVIPLVFDLSKGPAPSYRLDRALGRHDVSPIWMVFTPDLLLLGQSNMGGFWAIQRSVLDTAVKGLMTANRRG